VADPEQGEQRGSAQDRRNHYAHDEKGCKHYYLPIGPTTFDLRVTCAEPNHPPPAPVKPDPKSALQHRGALARAPREDR